MELCRSRQNLDQKKAGVGVIKGKWPASKPESGLRSFEHLAPEQEPEPLKFNRLQQLLLLTCQSEQFKNYSKSSDWLEKSRPSKKATFVLFM